MSFDLYFAGAKNLVVEPYLQQHNANRLCSQLIDRNCVELWCANKSASSKLFLDSGAYTAYTKGVVLSVDDYISYINSISSHLTIVAQLDTIPGRYGYPKTKEEIINAPRLSWENYLYMRERLIEPNKLVPIFHQGEDFKWLKNMLEWVDNEGKHIEYIGVSPAVDVPGLEEWLTESFVMIKNSSNPNVKTHAFGLTQLSVLEYYPYTSADSTSWKLSAAMGNIFTPWGTVYISSRNLKNNNSSFFAQPDEARNKIIDYIERQGFSLEAAMEKDTVRYIININYLLDWAKNYKYKGGTFNVKKQITLL